MTATDPTSDHVEPARRRAQLRAHFAGRRLRLGTRRSALAMAQSGMIADQLRAQVGCEVDLIPIVTAGDRSAAEISQIGGTGVFVSALRDALLAQEIDLAVHSLKDLPTATPPGLVLAAVPPREDTRDVLVSPSGRRLRELGRGARVATGSPRRAAQLRALRLDLDVVPIRGNVDTRIKKAIDGEVDAVVLAYAGLARLDRLDAVTEVIDPEVMLPAPGQGALAIECGGGGGLALAGPGRVLVGAPMTEREGVNREIQGVTAAWRASAGSTGGQTWPDHGQPVDGALAELLRFVLDDASSSIAVRAERAFLAAIEAGCTAPVGALAVAQPAPVADAGLVGAGSVATAGDASPAGRLRLRAVVAAPDGSTVLRRDVTGSAVDPEALGQRLADDMLSAGAHSLMGTS
ncbi:hydroxymethylbilane synthase [Frankia sp. AgPm24]|uniref:hydroxymethylbilane synthase n=1 Tax=Frankia sp. AgPm24 TaxID=631128 RepID=UPI00200BF9FC|nr:hydroxymethylbilane synthase [Frankia sp. AgPm24]MCK9924566.1 hydroxymethylbilane synthase [Frankia sp. AgPm24]